MTDNEVQQLFSQTLIGSYEDHAPWEAVSKLRSNGNRIVFEMAANWLVDSDPLKRARAAAILAQLRQQNEEISEPVWLFREESFGLIIDLLKHEENSTVLSSGVSALGHLANPDGIPIISSYKEHADEDVRFSVAFALGCYPNDPASVATLLELVTDDDPDVRDWAVFGVGVQGDVDSPEIRDALFERLTDSDEDVREEAAVGLGKRRDIRLLPVLRSLLDGPQLKVRIAEAASALLGLANDPEEWQAEDYKRALDQTFGTASA